METRSGSANINPFRTSAIKNVPLSGILFVCFPKFSDCMSNGCLEEGEGGEAGRLLHLDDVSLQNKNGRRVYRFTSFVFFFLSSAS